MTTSTRTPSRTRHKSPESPVRLTPHAGFGGKLPGKDPGSCNMNTGLAGQLTLPNDAFSVAIAALRSPAPRPVIAEDYAVVLKVWAKRHRDLARSRNQAACRLHAVLCDLVPGGVRKEISAGQAAHILEQVRPADAVVKARCELAAEFVEDIRRLDAQLRATNKKLAAAVRASGTSLTGIFGIGPVIAGTLIGDVRQVFRFPSRDHFAAYNGTAPVEVSSGGRKVCRLSLRGNRRIDQAIHLAAMT